jgi:hypothetical protein
MGDMIKMQMKDAFAAPMKNIMGEASKWIGKVLRPNGGTTAGTDAAATAAASTAALSSAATLAKESLGTMAPDGVSASTKAMITGVVAQGQETLASGTFTGSIALATTAVYSFAAALEAGAASSGGGRSILGTILSAGIGAFAPGTAAASVGNMPAVDYSLSTVGVRLALGGVLNEFGSVPLRKYAAGGVARSPQLALYGEAGPEAYVPLPDGRSIPVTMSGGQGGSNVSISIVVNKDGTEKSASSGDEAGTFKTMGERVKAVVREEMMKQARPGGMLYK